MSCLPGMPCYNSPVVKIVYPPGCDPTPVPVVSSDQVHYDGPNLPCTGVQNGDCLNVVLEKIDNKICSEELVASIIQTIENNDVLKAYFCQLVSGCLPSTTTTSTTIPVFSFNVWIVEEGTPCEQMSTTVYSLSQTLTAGVYVYTDAALTTPVTDGLSLWKYVGNFPNEYEVSIIYNNGQIYGFLGYTSCPTTTTSSSSTSTSTSSSSTTTTTTTSCTTGLTEITFANGILNTETEELIVFGTGTVEDACNALAIYLAGEGVWVWGSFPAFVSSFEVGATTVMPNWCTPVLDGTYINIESVSNPVFTIVEGLIGEIVDCSSTTTTTTTAAPVFELFVATGPDQASACAAFPASAIYCAYASVDGQIVYTSNTLVTPAANINFAYLGEYFTTDENGLVTFVAACA